VNDQPFSIIVFVEDIMMVILVRWSVPRSLRPLYNEKGVYGALADGYKRFRSVNTAYLADN